jgi:hypothetical protein
MLKFYSVHKPFLCDSKAIKKGKDLRSLEVTVLAVYA